MKFHVRSSKFHSLRGFVFLDITKIWKRRLFSCKISKVILLWFVKFQVFEFCFPLRFCKNIKRRFFYFDDIIIYRNFFLSNFLGLFLLDFLFCFIIQWIEQWKNHCVVCCGGSNNSKRKGVRHTLKRPWIDERDQCLFQNPIAWIQIQMFVLFFCEQNSKKTACNRGILKQVHESSHRWKIIFQRMKQKKRLYSCKYTTKRKYKKLCFFFFIYKSWKIRKTKKKKFTKKSKKKTWNFIFYWYIEIDHSGWSFYLWKILKW